jgi:hypothetical protein
MPMRLFELEGRPLLDLGSYARKGPGRRDHIPLAEVELIARTVHRTPEVMVKVLTRGGRDLGAVQRHINYLNRGGRLEAETDDEQKLAGKGTARQLLNDWDLDIEADRRTSALQARPSRSPPKLVHKVLFSMPPGTPPQKVLEAVKNFAREEFGLKHRYAMVLHTDEPHPHVHMVIKAVSEQGVRLNIRKATLRHWRREFAQCLRALGVPANATERAVRGENRSPQPDGLYRAEQRGESRRTQLWVQDVGRETLRDKVRSDAENAALAETGKEVERGWWVAGNILAAQGESKLAADVREFVRRMQRPKSDRDITADEPRNRSKDAQARNPLTR